MFDLLKERNFRLLWLGQLCSQFGDRLTQLVLVALVAQRAAGSTLTLAKVMVVTSLPGLLISPFAGVYVDRWDRKRTMIVCDFIRAATLLILPWLAMHRSPALLYVGIFLVFSVATFFVPARLALIPDLVSANKLSNANALFTSSGMIGATGIMLAGALMVEWIGAAKSCWVNAASYLLSAAAILPIHRNPRLSTQQKWEVMVILKEIGEGFWELWRHANTRRVIALLSLLMVGAGASFVVGTVLVQKALGSVTKDLGFLSLWMGIGMLIGALAYGRWGVFIPRWRMIGISFIGCAVGLWAFIWTVVQWHSGVAASAATAFMGIWIAPVGITANTLVHEAHPERLHGRIFSSLGVVINFSLITSMLVSGWLVERGGRQLLLSGVGALFAVSGLVLLCYTRGLRKEIVSHE